MGGKLGGNRGFLGGFGYFGVFWVSQFLSHFFSFI